MKATYRSRIRFALSVEPFQQSELVKTNFYQEQNSAHILALLISLNKQILEIVKVYLYETLSMQLKNNQTKEMCTIEWLIQDYIKHMNHHIDQLK